jgi:uncharacterized protein YjiS (DUF1127 family)
VSEETYSLIALLTGLASLVVIFLRWRQQRILRRILKSLTDEQRQALGLPPKTPNGI